MAYARTHVKQALSAAREAGKPVDGLMAGDRETAIMLEKWGYLPIDQDAVDKRIADWYVANGLAWRGDDSDTPTSRRDDTPEDTPVETPVNTPVDARGVPTLDVLAAAESALETARVALSVARSMATAGGGAS